MSSKPILITDLDNTLVDTPLLKQRLFALLDSAEIPADAAAEVRAAFKPFQHERYRELEHSAQQAVKTIYERYNAFFDEPGGFNFPGVEEFLEALSRHFAIWVLTYGDAALQKKKLRQSGLERYLKKVFITDQRSKEQELRRLRKTAPGAILLDDDPAVCNLAASLGFRPIVIRKEPKDEAYYQDVLGQIERM